MGSLLSAVGAPVTAGVLDHDRRFRADVARALIRRGFFVVPMDPGRDGDVAVVVTHLALATDDRRQARVQLLCVPPDHHHEIRELVAEGHAVVSRDAGSERIAMAAHDALCGWTQVPISRPLVPSEPTGPFRSEEISWLTQLAAGRRMIDVASTHALSERQLYRQMRAMYERIGVRGRAEAIALAASGQLLEDLVVSRGA